MPGHSRQEKKAHVRRHILTGTSSPPKGAAIVRQELGDQVSGGDTYNIQTYFRAINDTERGAFPNVATRVGTTAPPFDLPLVGGGSCSLAQLREQGHVVLIFGSFTTPPLVAQLPALETLHRTYGGRGFAFLHVYTREIHPGENLPPHGTMEQKLDHAGQMRDYARITFPIGVDDLDGTVHKVYGALPSMAIIVHRDGTIVYRASWAEAGLIQAMLEDLLRRDRAEAGRPMSGSSSNPWRSDDRGRLIYNESITFMELEPAEAWNILDLAGPKARADVMAGEHPANKLLQSQKGV
jgi:hypothetical protein